MLFRCSVMSDSFCDPMDCRPERLLFMGCCLWNFPGKSTGVDSHFLLQGIILTQGSNQHLLHYKWILYHWDTTETLQCTIDRLKLYLKLFSLIDLAELLLRSPALHIELSQAIAKIPQCSLNLDSKEVRKRNILLLRKHKSFPDLFCRKPSECSLLPSLVFSNT